MIKNRITEKLDNVEKQGRKALSVFITAGFPDRDSCLDRVLEICKYADMVELGVPFSDPIADGPTIQYSSQKALENGADLKYIFSLVKAVRARTSVPLILMSYLNPINSYGMERFFKDLSAAGGDGVILPDLPLEENSEVIALAASYGISFIPLVALTTAPARAGIISEKSTGFVYVTAVTGVTGARSSIDSGLIPFLKKMRKVTGKRLFVGFGISGPEHVKKIKPYCDGFIIGSAVIDTIRKGRPLGKYLSEIVKAL
jgi:tryptophan synthase alpha chain